MVCNRLKTLAKRNPVLSRLNALVKARLTERRYAARARRYACVGMRTEVRRHPGMPKAVVTPGRRFTIAYCGASEDQDRSGMLPSLERAADVHIFTTPEFGYGISACATMPAALASVKIAHAFRVWFAALQQSVPVDFVIGQFHPQGMTVETLRWIQKRGVPCVNISMDDRLSFNPRRTEGAPYFFGGVVGTTTTCPECVTWYLQEGEKVLYWPEASDPEIFRPGTQRDLDVVFVGSRYGMREQLIQALRKAGVTVHAYGPGWEHGAVTAREMAALFGRAKIVLGLGYVGHSRKLRILKLRDFDGPMSGACYVTSDTPDLLTFYDVGKEIVCYRDTAECVDRVRHLLAHEAERVAIGAAGRRRAEQEHTWDRRWRDVLQWIPML